MALATLLQTRGADFEVTTTADLGVGSLRQAIEDTNDNPGPDRIIFNIPGSGVQTIRPVTVLPALTDPVVVDGYTQPGARVNTLSNGENAVLLIQLDGALVPTGPGLPLSAGLRLAGGLSTIRGLVVNRFVLGVFLESDSNVVAGNFIGPDPSGRVPLGNGEGVDFWAVCCNTIGGVDPADRNVIAGNTSHAIYISEIGLPPAVDNVILGNFIGTDSTGLARMPAEERIGSFVVWNSIGLTIGGLEPGARNIIACGNRGVNLDSGAFVLENTRILGNYFGVGADGTTPLGHTNTIAAVMASSNIRIEGNRIAFQPYGVRISGRNVTLSQNQVYSNRFGGIFLGAAGLTNDVGDVDTGPNGLQNFPVLSSATRVGTDLIVEGSMGSKPDTSYHLEFFANAAVDSSGFAQGEVYLGSVEVATPTSGAAPVQAQLPVPPGGFPWITATATDPDGNTSTFSLPVPTRSSTTLQIMTQPAVAGAPPGANASFNVEVSGAAPILYQWRRDGTDLIGETNAALTLTNVQVASHGFYSVRITNPLGSVESEPAELLVLIVPTFVVQPIAQTIAPGEFVTLSAVVTNTATLPLSFRWRSNATVIASTISTQYATFLTVRPPVDTTYSVVATNAALRAGLVSALARILVAADRDHDGLPDAYETRAGLDPDNPADAAADSDSDGLSNVEEYVAGTDPHDAGSRLRIQLLSTGSGGAVMEFPAASNKTYSVQYRDSAGVTGWQTLTNLPAQRTNGVVTVTDSPGASERLYRVVTPQRP